MKTNRRGFIGQMIGGMAVTVGLPKVLPTAKKLPAIEPVTEWMFVSDSIPVPIISAGIIDLMWESWRPPNCRCVILPEQSCPNSK